MCVFHYGEFRYKLTLAIIIGIDCVTKKAYLLHLNRDEEKNANWKKVSSGTMEKVVSFPTYAKSTPLEADRADQGSELVMANSLIIYNIIILLLSSHS